MEVRSKGNGLDGHTLGPEFEQWKNQYDTCGIVRISGANPEA
jgi:hypothetical protein